jgi:Tol biopolymer transport system component
MYFAGARFGSRPAVPPAITQLTFRNGTVRGARFAPDGRTVVYAAAWEGEPIKLFSARPGSPESSPLPLPPSDLFAISSTGEMALALGAGPAGPFLTEGTLARAALAGGAPRQLLEHVSAADWSPDSTRIAAIQSGTASGRLEYPLGTERLTTPYWLSDVRISPDGESVAFIAHTGGGDDGEVQVVGKTGPPRVLSRGWLSIQGLAWAPGGRELWFTGTRSGMMRALWAVSLDGRERLLYRAPIRLMLQDVSPDGRVLLTGMTMHSEIRFGSLRQKTERSLSWFDWATGMSMSADAGLIAFTESGEGTGEKYGLFVRPTSGGPALRVADGNNAVMSPDGKLVAFRDDDGRRVHVVPTGAGPSRTLDSGLERILEAGWFPDSQRLAMVGRVAGHKPRTYELNVVSGTSGKVAPLTPEGTAGRAVSPNGEWLAVLVDGVPNLFNLRTRTLLRQGDLSSVIDPQRQRLAGWSADSTAIFLTEVDGRSASLFRVELASLARTPMGRIEPNDATGVLGLASVTIAPDGDHYAYIYSRQLSQLYVMQAQP